MSQSRGTLRFEPLFTAEDIGLRKGASVEHVMKVFVTIGEAMASRWIEMPRGVLLLQTVPRDPASGAIYLYDRELQVSLPKTRSRCKSVSSTRVGMNSSVSENTCRIAECERPAVSAPGAEGHRRAVCVYIKEEAMAQAARRSYRW
jgi:hypothetical protein